MRKIYVMLLLLTAILFSGCATTKGYEKVIDSWTGSHIDSLVQSWGPPSSVYTMESGDKMYTWMKSNSGTVIPLSGPLGTTYHSVQHFCKTTFYASKAGTIYNWRWEGNSCRQ